MRDPSNHRVPRWLRDPSKRLIRLFCDMFQLPLNLNTLTEAERKKRLEARKPRIKVKIEEDLDSSFDSKKYLKYFKKWVYAPRARSDGLHTSRTE